MKYIFYLSFFAAMLLTAQGCIEDGYTSSPSDRPEFSVDTLKMGTVFTGEGTATHRFVVYNRHSKGLLISSVELTGANASCFRLNVDGLSGKTFRDVEIRANDSIYVFAEATLPLSDSDSPQEICADIEFITNGSSDKVVVSAFGQDVVNLSGITVDTDQTWSSGRPFRILDTLRVASGATLTLAPGSRLLFHDKAAMIVDGTLRSEGTPDKPVTVAGDRTGNVVGQISFDLMSQQWEGIHLTSRSSGHELSHTVVCNTEWGLIADSTDVRLVNCVMRNSGTTSFLSRHSKVTAIGCEFAEAGESPLKLVGGDTEVAHCTIANYYLFSVLRGPAVGLSHMSSFDPDEESAGQPYIKANFSNSIIYGNGSELSQSSLDGTEVYFRRCLFKSSGTDDNNFINCLWAEDPMYYTVREDYIFDYRLRPESPAIGAADPSLTPPAAASDRYGLPRGTAPDLGAYVFRPE